MEVKNFVEILKKIATDYKTLYVMGGIGSPLTDKNKQRYCNNYDYNRDPKRTAMIQAATDDTFAFDCVCLVKAVLWGWNGDKNHIYGGATYKSNGVPDEGVNQMLDYCYDISDNFADIIPGEYLWMDGHCGVYIGDGLAVECTPKWDNKVQITAVENIGAKAGYNSRRWVKHGKLTFINYDVCEEKEDLPKNENDIDNSKKIIESIFEFFLKILKIIGRKKK